MSLCSSFILKPTGRSLNIFLVSTGTVFTKNWAGSQLIIATSLLFLGRRLPMTKTSCFRAPSHTVIGYYALNGQMCSMAHTPPTATLVLHRTRISKCAMKKSCINGQLRDKLFWSLNFFIFQLSKAGQRPLHTCQLQKGGVFWSLDRRTNDCKLRNEKKVYSKCASKLVP